MLARLFVATLVATILWILWQKRYVIWNGIMRTSPGTVKVSMDRNYTAQKVFLREIRDQESMKLVAFLYAISGIDKRYGPAFTMAALADGQQAAEICQEFRKVFGYQKFTFGVEEAYANPAHYQTMCREMGQDVRLLRIYLQHKTYLEALLSIMQNRPDFYAQRNPDIIPNPDVMQLLWSGHLERP